MKDKAFIDTNILLYAHDVSNKEKQEKSQKIIFQGLSDNTMVISTQVLAEYFVAATRKMGMSVSDVRKEIVLLGEAQISEISFSMILEAIDIRQQPRLQEARLEESLMLIRGPKW